MLWVNRTLHRECVTEAYNDITQITVTTDLFLNQVMSNIFILMKTQNPEMKININGLLIFHHIIHKHICSNMKHIVRKTYGYKT